MIDATSPFVLPRSAARNQIRTGFPFSTACAQLQSPPSAAPPLSVRPEDIDLRPSAHYADGCTMRLLPTVALLAAILIPTTALPACGDRGGPGYRGPSGRCVGWADIGRTCGSPPTTRCTAERTSEGAESAADHGQKAVEIGKAARGKGGTH